MPDDGVSDPKQDPAADLTRSIATVLHWLALVVFGVGSVVLLLVMLFGDLDEPGRVAPGLVMGVAAFCTALFVIVRRSRLAG